MLVLVTVYVYVTVSGAGPDVGFATFVMWIVGGVMNEPMSLKIPSRLVSAGLS